MHNCGTGTNTPETDSGSPAVRTFYSVQGPEDSARLLENGGEPWPSGSGPGGSLRDIFGPGLYTWETQAQAEAYLAGMTSRGASGLQILQHSIPEDALSQLRFGDMTSMSDDDANALLDTSPDHGFQWVRRMTGRYGPENYFSPDTYPLFTSSVL